MKALLSIKMLLRSPLRTLLTLLLLAAVSFGLLSRVSEYAVLHREMGRAMSYYRGVVALDTGVPNTTELSKISQVRDKFNWGNTVIYNTRPPALTKEQISSIASLPQVTSSDIRYMTAGISDRYERIGKFAMYSEEYYYTARFVMEATFEKYDTNNWNQNTLNLYFSNYQMLAAPNSLSKKGAMFTITSYITDGVDVSRSSSGTVDHIIANNPFGLEFAKSLVSGSKYLLIGRFEANSLSDFILGDFDTIDYCPSIWELDGKAENYLETEEFAKVREVIDITNNDYRTNDMVYTSDMLSIPRFAQEKMVVSEGRALTREDDGANHCVVSLAYLKKNRLNIGDTITITLGSKLLEQHSGMGAVAVVPQRHSLPVKTVELEIVGAYIDTDTNYERSANMYWGYSPNTIFVPSSLLPIEVPQDHKIKPGELSLVIGNAKEMQNFLNVAQPLAEELGMDLLFYDGGWFQVNQYIKASAQASLITVVVFTVASALVIWLVIHLFIGRNKRQYAIMRALGTPRKVVRRSFLLSLGLLTATAIPLGGALGLYVVLRSVSSAISDLSAAVTSQYVPDTSLPVSVIVTCFIGQVAFLALITMTYLVRLDKISPLVLLQGEAKVIKAEKKVIKKRESNKTVPTQEAVAAFPMEEGTVETSKIIMDKAAISTSRNKYGAIRHVSRYISHHISRTKWKSILSLFLTVLLPTAMGLFAITVISYEELSKSIEVKCLMTDISSDLAVEISSSQLVRNPYYRQEIDVYINKQIFSPNIMVLTNDIDRTLRSDGVKEYSVEYADGYTWSGESEDEAWCLIGERIAAIYGVIPGDKLTLLGGELLQRMFMMYTPQEVEVLLDKKSVTYRVGGIISADSLKTADSIFALSGIHAKDVYGDTFAVEQVELILDDNNRAEELRSYAESIKRKSLRYSQFASYIMDTSKLENVIQMRNLLNLLFPLVVVAVTLIGSVVPFIIIIQSSKEAALFRILGTTKLRTRCILTLEQLFLCIVGLILATACLVAYNLKLMVKSSGVLIFCSGMYLLCYILSVIVASILVTRRRALELLQTKE